MNEVDNDNKLFCS